MTSTSGTLAASFVSTAMVASLVRALGPRARGIGLERLAGVASLDALKDPTVRLANGVDDAVFSAAARALRQPSLGVWFGQEVAGEHALGSLGYLARHAETVDQAFRRVVRYHRLFTSGEATQVERGARTVSIVEGASTARSWSPVMGDAVLATWLSMVRRWTGHPIAPISVSLAYARPAHAPSLERCFGPAVRFDAPAFMLELPKDVLGLPLVGADPVLGAILEAHAQELLGLHGHAETIVRDVSAAFAAGHHDLGGVARLLRIEPRTLQRRLAELQLDFRELRDAHRCRVAERLLLDRRRSLKEVAVAVGFADATGLRRAFLRWKGAPPRGQLAPEGGDWRSGEKTA